MPPSDLPPRRRLNQDMRSVAEEGRASGGAAGRRRQPATGANIIPRRSARQRRRGAALAETAANGGGQRRGRSRCRAAPARASSHPPHGLPCARQLQRGPRMAPRKTAGEANKGIFEVEWPMFGELSRALALKVVREYDPEIIVGIATAGVVP